MARDVHPSNEYDLLRGREIRRERGKHKQMTHFRRKLVCLGAALIGMSGFGTAQTKAPGLNPAHTGAGGQSFSAQARRGQGAYVKNCAMCHAENLAGREPAPALTGATFMKKWQGKSIWDLYDKIRKTMPQQNRGSLSPKTYLDIVAYVAKFNDINAGPAALTNDPKALKSLVIKKPGGTQEAALKAGSM